MPLDPAATSGPTRCGRRRCPGSGAGSAVCCGGLPSWRKSSSAGKREAEAADALDRRIVRLSDSNKYDVPCGNGVAALPFVHLCRQPLQARGTRAKTFQSVVVRRSCKPNQKLRQVFQGGRLWSTCRRPPLAAGAAAGPESFTLHCTTSPHPERVTVGPPRPAVTRRESPVALLAGRAIAALGTLSRSDRPEGVTKELPNEHRMACIPRSCTRRLLRPHFNGEIPFMPQPECAGVLPPACGRQMLAP